jgi:hypothetical protein
VFGLRENEKITRGELARGKETVMEGRRGVLWFVFGKAKEGRTALV